MWNIIWWILCWGIYVAKYINFKIIANCYLYFRQIQQHILMLLKDALGLETHFLETILAWIITLP